MRRLLCLLLLPLLLLGCRDDAGPKPLRVICEATFPPYEYHVKEAIDGIDPALCTIFADCLGRPLDLQDIAFDALIAAVSVGKADIAASGITVTEERARQVAFSAPYVTSAQVAVVPIDSPLRAPEDLPGHTIAVQSGSTGDLHVTRHIGEPERYKTVIDAVNAVRNQKAHAAVVDRQPAQVFIAKNATALRILPAPVATEDYALAFPKDNPKEVTAVTNFRTHPVRFLSMGSNGTLCYTYDGEIYTQKAGRQPQKVAIDIVLPSFAVKNLSIEDVIDDFALHPEILFYLLCESTADSDDFVSGLEHITCL